MSPVDEYDVVVIGGGPAGEVAAQYAIAGSARTCALVEAELLGGECSYYACMPSKALLVPVEAVATARQLGGVAPAPGLDTERLLRRRDVWRSQLDDSGQVDWARGVGIEVVRGRGRLAGERLVEVAGDAPRTLRARHAVVLATGSVPTIPDDLAPLAPWTSRDATGVAEVPDSLLIVGGGVVACEAATWLSALGCDVTVLVRGDRLLSRLEPFAGELVRRRLQASGVTVRTGASVAEAHRDAPDAAAPTGRRHGGRVRARVGNEWLEADEILVAAGRRPGTDGLGLETVGLSPEDLGGDRMPGWLHAVGDVSGEAQLTHWGKYRARLAGDAIAARAEGRAPARAPERVPVPQAVFTDPPIGAVGWTESEARSRGVDVRIIDRPITSAAGASLARDDAEGQARLVVDRSDGTLVGATFVGPAATELVHAATVAIVGRVPLDALWHAVPSYPTVSEVWLHLLEAARSDAG